MVTKYEIETQCDRASFLTHLPQAIQHRPYTVDGSLVKIYDGRKVITLTIADEEIRTLGSLTLPMERIVFEFPDHSDEEAALFIQTYRTHALRTGGG